MYDFHTEHQENIDQKADTPNYQFQFQSNRKAESLHQQEPLIYLNPIEQQHNLGWQLSGIAEVLTSAYDNVGSGAAVVALDVTIVVRAGELTAEDWALEPALAGVLTAASVAVGVAATGVLEAGEKDGVVTVHWGQMVTVSVVKKVETLVMTSTDVLPDFLVWVVVVSGQLVTVV